VYYPANYGFIPQSYCEDKDPLDILILSQIDVVPMCIVPAKVIGVMRMLDNGEADDKIIAVAAGDPSVSHIHDISALPAHFISEMRNFFEDYKKLENKTVVVEDFLDKPTALRILQDSFDMYNDLFRNRDRGQERIG
jgi:inorganic pyrophosphatase